MSEGLNLNKEKSNIDFYLIFPMKKKEYLNILKKKILQLSKKGEQYIKLALYNTKDETDKNDTQYIRNIKKWNLEFQKENSDIDVKIVIGEQIYIKRTMREISFIF